MHSNSRATRQITPVSGTVCLTPCTDTPLSIPVTSSESREISMGGERESLQRGAMNDGSDEEFVVVEPKEETSPEHDAHPEGRHGEGEASLLAPPELPPSTAVPSSSLSTEWTSSSPSSVHSSSPSTAGQSGVSLSHDMSSPGDDATAVASEARSNASPGAIAKAMDNLSQLFNAYATLVLRFLRSHGGVVYEFLHAHGVVVLEFVYAYSVVVVHEALAILEKACSFVKSTWQRVEDRSPASVKRAIRHFLLPVMVSIMLSLLLVLPAYWAFPRGSGQQRLSAQEWQAKHDLLSSKHSAETVRQRIKYDNLANKHLELQAEYDSLAKQVKNQYKVVPSTGDGQRATLENWSEPESVLGSLKDAVKVAEQSAYEYFSHFAEGLREDIHEIAERCLGGWNQKGGNGIWYGDASEASGSGSAKGRLSSNGVDSKKVKDKSKKKNGEKSGKTTPYNAKLIDGEPGEEAVTPKESKKKGKERKKEDKKGKKEDKKGKKARKKEEGKSGDYMVEDARLLGSKPKGKESSTKVVSSETNKSKNTKSKDDKKKKAKRKGHGEYGSAGVYGA